MTVRNLAFIKALLDRFNATRIYIWLGGVSLLFLVFLVPPFQVPDKPQHFFRSYQLSKLEVWSHMQDGTAGSELPASLPEFVKHFMGTTALHTSRMVPSQRLIDTFAELQRPLDPGRTVFVDMSGIQQPAPVDFVTGTGRLRTVCDLCAVAYGHIGKDWEDNVISDPRFVRTTKTGATVADPSKAERELVWRATTNFEALIAQMVDAHIAAMGKS